MDNLEVLGNEVELQKHLDGMSPQSKRAYFTTRYGSSSMTSSSMTSSSMKSSTVGGSVNKAVEKAKPTK